MYFRFIAPDPLNRIAWPCPISCPDCAEVEDKPEEHGVLDSDRPYSIADEIEKYAKLRDRGVITEEEFAQQKKKLLDLDPLGRK